MAAIFVTIALMKVKLIPDIYTWAFVLINQGEENVEKQFSFLNIFDIYLLNIKVFVS